MSMIGFIFCSEPHGQPREERLLREGSEVIKKVCQRQRNTVGDSDAHGCGKTIGQATRCSGVILRSQEARDPVAQTVVGAAFGLHADNVADEILRTEIAADSRTCDSWIW